MIYTFPGAGVFGFSGRRGEEKKKNNIRKIYQVELGAKGQASVLLENRK